jgi:hypothetical protein
MPRDNELALASAYVGTEEAKRSTKAKLTKNVNFIAKKSIFV